MKVELRCEDCGKKSWINFLWDPRSGDCTMKVPDGPMGFDWEYEKLIHCPRCGTEQVLDE